MVDEMRSRTMRAVRLKDTTPEMTIRRMAHALGFRFRLHRKQLTTTRERMRSVTSAPQNTVFNGEQCEGLPSHPAL